MTSRASGELAVASANAAISWGSRRRLNTEPTKSTSGSAPGARVIRRCRGLTPGAITSTRPESSRMWRTISSREKFESVNMHRRCPRRAARQPAAPQPLARPEPLGMREERDVVDRERQRHARGRAGRCRRARRTTSSGSCRRAGAQGRLLPPCAAVRRRQHAQVYVALGGSGSDERRRGEQDEPARGRIGARGPALQQLGRGSARRRSRRRSARARRRRSATPDPPSARRPPRAGLAIRLEQRGCARRPREQPRLLAAGLGAPPPFSRDRPAAAPSPRRNQPRPPDPP